MDNLQNVLCPYCGETFETEIDASTEGTQEYIEDCYVCCRPIVFHVETESEGGQPRLEVRREDD